MIDTFRLRDQHGEHPSAHMRGQGATVKAWIWWGGTTPSWTSYCVDAQSLPGKLLVVSPDGEDIAQHGDALLLTSTGRIVVMDGQTFTKHYKEAV